LPPPGGHGALGTTARRNQAPDGQAPFRARDLAAAHELRNTACALAHGKALREFFTDAQVLAIAEDRFDGILTAAEQAMVMFARQIAKDASRVTADQVAALKEHDYTDAEIFDIAATAAGRAFFTKVLDALGVEPDAPFLAFYESFRRVLTVGRPIDLRECVTMPMPKPLRPAPGLDVLK
jgi:hypothetical protein